MTHYTPPHTGGIERVAASLVRGLRARGHELQWIASAQPERPGARDGVTRVASWNVLERRFSMPYPLWSPRAFAALAALVRWADVVHAHDCLYQGSVAAALLARRAGKPFVITQHVGYVPFGAVVDVAERIAYRTVGRFVLRRADAAVVVSRHVREHFPGIAFDYIPNGIDTHRFRDASRAERRGKTMLFVGRLVPKKGLLELLDAHERLAADGVELLVVGDGPLRGHVEGRRGVRHIASVVADAMPAVYASADVFVLPSRGEGLPLSVQEAMASGLPVVVSTDEAYRANLADAPGVRFASGGADVAAAVRELFATDVDREAIAQYAEERWSVEAFLDAYEALLQRTVEERS